MSSVPHTFTSVIIMSSIMEHMCADVFQQTAATLRPPVEGQEPIPYRNLLPAKDPIHVALSKQFQTVLRKGWVDSRALHLFESLLNMGGVFWFTNNLVKVGGSTKGADRLRINSSKKNLLILFLINRKKREKCPSQFITASGDVFRSLALSDQQPKIFSLL